MVGLKWFFEKKSIIALQQYINMIDRQVDRQT